MSALSHEELLGRMTGFLREIGLAVRAGPLDGCSVLDGLHVQHGVLVYDPAKLKYPGDLLHEAGHLAVKLPADRQAAHGDMGGDAAEEMMAISWSYAAALHLKIPPEIVFHSHGYKGGAQSLLNQFAAGHYLALPMLQWVGLAYDHAKARELGAEPFPKMQRWLRPERCS